MKTITTGVINTNKHGFWVDYEKSGDFFLYRKLMVPDHCSGPIKNGAKVKIKRITKDTLPGDLKKGVVFVEVEAIVSDDSHSSSDSVAELEEKYWLDSSNRNRLISPDGWIISKLDGVLKAYHSGVIRTEMGGYTRPIDIREPTETERHMFDNMEQNRRIVFEHYLKESNESK